jgi:hypothetical protein
MTIKYIHMFHPVLLLEHTQASMLQCAHTDYMSTSSSVLYLLLLLLSEEEDTGESARTLPEPSLEPLV